MHRHIKIVAWIYIVYGVFFLLSALAVGGLLGGVSTAVRETALTPEMMAIGIGTLVGGLALFGILALAGGLGLLKHRGWGRIVVLIVVALTIFGFPVGTVLGAYAIWVLTRPETRRILGGADSYTAVRP